MNNLVNHINKQMGYALVLTKDINNAKDLLQDLAVRVFSNVAYYNYKTDKEISKLLSRSLKNLHIDRWRKLQTQPTVELPANISNKSVENDAWQRLQKQELQKALATIAGKKMGVCFRLKLEGFNIKEITKLSDCNTNQVLQNIMRGKKYLSKKLAA